MLPPLTPGQLQAQTGVSRETIARLETYVALLKSWNRRINLVGPNTIGDVWRRHILDSAQLFPMIPPTARRLIDFGSGAGLPGLILAIMGVPEVHLVESDQRKVAFMREAARVTGTTVMLHPQRAEKLPVFAADVITARALAPVERLLDLASNFINLHSILLFLKGQTAQDELTQAAKAWKMRATLHPSLSDPSGSILRLEQVIRAGTADEV
ncbi:MAG: rsmG [Rhodospirillales bacterium]|nr:rsmG [Rhodospirillales bacterium]